MRNSSTRIVFLSIFFSVGCVAQNHVENISEELDACVFEFQEPLGAFLVSGQMEFSDGQNVIDFAKNRIGGLDSWVQMPACDRDRWHCIKGVGAPLFIPKPFFKGTHKWTHERYDYEFGRDFRLDLKGGIMVKPLLVYGNAGKSNNRKEIEKIESVYFFDGNMNLIGYSNQIVDSTEGGYHVDAAWLKGSRASLECY